jgi:hypothetical protein
MPYRKATPEEVRTCARIQYWSTPRAAQGQIVEVSYSEGPGMRRPAECDHGDQYRRVVDTSEGPDARPAYSVWVRQ